MPRRRRPKFLRRHHNLQSITTSKKMSANRHCQFYQKMKALSTQHQFLATDNTTIALADLSLLNDIQPKDKLPVLLAGKLSSAEVQKLATFTYKKRYTEWLGGRLAAKYCIELFHQKAGTSPPEPNTFSIGTDEHGRPHLVIASHRPPSVSISHSKGYAAAYVSHTQSCGIDIQQITSKMLTVAEKFTNQGEESLFQDTLNHLLNLTIIWVAKEAVKKSLLHDKPITFSGTNVIEVEKTGSNTWKLQCDVIGSPPTATTVKIAAFNDFIIGCTEGAPHA